MVLIKDYLLISIVSMGMGLVGKILFDWFKNNKSTGEKPEDSGLSGVSLLSTMRELVVDVSSIRSAIDTELPKIVGTFSQKMFDMQVSMQKMWLKQDEMCEEICQVKRKLDGG